MKTAPLAPIIVPRIASTIAEAVASIAKAAAIVLQVTVNRKATAAPVVTAVKEDAPVAAAPSKWPPRLNSRS